MTLAVAAVTQKLLEHQLPSFPLTDALEDLFCWLTAHREPLALLPTLQGGGGLVAPLTVGLDLQEPLDFLDLVFLERRHRCRGLAHRTHDVLCGGRLRRSR